MHQVLLLEYHTSVDWYNEFIEKLKIITKNVASLWIFPSANTFYHNVIKTQWQLTLTEQSEKSF